MNYNFDLLDTWPYAVINLIFLVCLSNKVEKKSKIIFLTLFIFSAFRYDVGWDYMTYVSEVKSDFSNILNSRFEPLSKVVFLLGNILNFYPIVFIIFSFLILYLVYRAINRFSIDPLVSWVLFYSFPLFFFASLSTLRQSLATALLFFSYKYLQEKNYTFFFGIIIIASCFHISALAGLILLPLFLFPFGRILNTILFILSFFVSNLLLSYVINLDYGLSSVSRLKIYIEEGANNSDLLIYLYYAIGVINLLLFNKLVRLNPSNKTFITFTNFGLVVLNLFSFEPTTSLRISAFFLIFLLYLIPQYLKLFEPISAQLLRKSVVFGFLLMSILYLNIYIEAYENGILWKISFLPYKFWWNNI